MNRSILYGIVTVLAVIGSIAIVIYKSIPADEMQLLLSKGVVPASLISPGANRAGRRGTRPDDPDAEPIKAEPVERTYEELNKILTSLPRLKEIPWQSSEISSAFSSGKARACRLLPPGTAIHPDLTSDSNSDEKLLCQRSTAFLVGLKIDPRARNSLPAISKSTIEDYLLRHSLAIQPEICQHSDGRFMLTGDVHAAFFEKKFSSVTISPEPMINDAVKGFRVLGVLVPENSNEENLVPRTVVLAFSYVRDQTGSTNLLGNAAVEYELLFLHLLQPQEGQIRPELTAFTTKDGRTVFEELDLRGQDTSSGDPAIMASIRFESFKMMAYPADPVVTGLSNRVRISLSVEELRKHLEGRNGAEAISMENILDEIHRQATLASAAPASGRSGS